VGSFCPHCSSGEVELKLASGSGSGKCKKCGGEYKVDTYVRGSNDLWARIEWNDMNVAKVAARKARECCKKDKLAGALKSKGLEEKFRKADVAGKARIVAGLHDEGAL